MGTVTTRVGLAGRRRTEQLDAFISYARSSDGELAPLLRRGLERLARPVFRIRALRVFVDESDLAADGHLGERLRAQLDEARFLIVLASPAAVGSKWVGNEIAHWVERKGTRNLLLALTEGELVWNDDERRYDPIRSTALPPALAGEYAIEPIWVDLRWTAGEVAELDLDHVRFKSAVLSLAAPIHGVSKADLDSEARREHNRLIRFRRAMFGLLAVLLATAVGLAIAATIQRNRAVREADLSLSRALAAQSVRATNEGNPALGLALAAESASRVTPITDETYEALLTARAAFANQPAHRIGPARVAASGIASEAEFAPDGSLVATSGTQGTIAIWNPDTGELIHEASHGDGTFVTDVSFGPDGSVIASAGHDGRVRLWTRRLEPMREFQAPTRVEAVQFVDGGDHVLAILWDTSVIVWDLDGREIDRFTDPFDGQLATAWAVDPAGDFLAMGEGYEGEIRVRDLRLGAWSEPMLHAGVARLVFDPTGTTLASSGFRDFGNSDLSGEVRFWDAASARPTGTPLVGHRRAPSAIEYLADGQVLLTTDPTSDMRLWWADGGRPLGEPIPVRSILVDGADGRLVTIAPGSSSVEFWRHDVTRAMEDDLPRPRALEAAALGSDGWITELVGTPDETIEVRRRRPDGDVVERVPMALDGGLATIDVIPERNWLVATSPDHATRFFDLVTGDVIRELDDDGLLVRASPDGTLVATFGAASGLFRLWDVDTGNEVREPGRRALSLSVAFSGDGTRIATADWLDMAVEVFDAATGDVIFRFTDLVAPGPLALSEDGTELAATDAFGRIFVVDLSSDEPRVRGMIGVLEAMPSALAFGPDSLLVAADQSGAIRLWDTVTGRRFGDALPAHTDVVRLLAFAPDGSLVTVGREGAARQWPALLDPRAACALAAPYVTEEQVAEFLPDGKQPTGCAYVAADG